MRRLGLAVATTALLLVATAAYADTILAPGGDLATEPHAQTVADPPPTRAPRHQR